MKSHAVARRYARALFALAEEQGVVDAVGAALTTTAELLEDPRVGRVLAAPVSQEKKRELLRTIAAKTMAPTVFRDLLLLLVERARLNQLSAIRAVFDQLVDRKRGRTRAKVRSAVVLTDDTLAELTKVFGTVTGKQVLADVQVDPELLAGVIVEVDGRVYDGSLRTQLGKLRRQMATAT